MAEYSRLAKGNFTATGSTAVVVLPFTPDYVELWNYSNIKTAGTHLTTRAWWDAKLLDGANNPTMVEIYSSSSTSTVYDIITNTTSNLAINSFQGGLLQQFGPTQTVTGITLATNAVVTVTNHGYAVGDTVIMQGLPGGTNNMQLLDGVPFTISAVTTNTFTIKWNTSGSNYLNSGFTATALVKKVLFPFLYVPQDNVISALTLAATTTVQTTMYHNFEPGQEIAFRIPTLWGTTQLNSLPNNVIPGSPIYGYVTSVTDNWTFVVNINSASFTAYNNNFAMTSATLPGLSYPQVLSVGDVNTGGLSFGVLNNTTLYPPPGFPTSTNRVGTINGPAIRGAFVNNTSQGFTIGAGTAATDGTATLIANTNIIYWHAYQHDFGSP